MFETVGFARSFCWSWLGKLYNNIQYHWRFFFNLLTRLRRCILCENPKS